MFKLFRIIISYVGFIGYALVKYAPYVPFKNADLSSVLRVFFCENVCHRKCGKRVTIERGATFGRNITLGDRSGIGRNAWFKGPVEIGEDVLMAPGVAILTENDNFSDPKVTIIEQGSSGLQPVVIGNDCWLGQNCIILPGVLVGNGSVVGAGSVVTKSIPEYSIYAGVPARLIKTRA